MCRFAAYLGGPIALSDILNQPQSLIQQSRDAKESSVKVNADGFGIGWYFPEVSHKPAVYVSPVPVWSDLNIHNFSNHLISPCFFGHVRAGEDFGVSQLNCHPFHYDKWMMMHNGGIGSFRIIKRDLINGLSQDLFSQIKGQTDSEHLFALWLKNYLPTEQTLNDMAESWRKTIEQVEGFQRAHEVTTPNYINSIVTDGQKMCVIKYSSRTEEVLSLHYAAGKAFQHGEGKGYHMIPAKNDEIQAVLIASEKLNHFNSEWKEVRDNSILGVEQTSKGIEIREFEI